MAWSKNENNMKQRSSISITELKQLLDSNKNIQIIDVRTETEYLEKHIPQANNIPIENIKKVDFPKNGIIITVCGKGGGRSERAAELIRNETTNEVYFLEGGTWGWFE